MHSDQFLLLLLEFHKESEMLASIAFRVLQRLLRQISWAIVLLNVGNYLLAEDALPKGSLIGRIVDPDGKPVGDARVWINTSRDKILAEARSDTEGHFRLNDIEPTYRPYYTILIEADGFARQYIPGQSISIFPGIDNDLGDIRLDRGRVYNGQVLDVDGKPRSDAQATCIMYIHELGNTVHTMGPDYHLTLDSEGRFRTPPMPVAEVIVSVDAPNRQLAWKECHVQPGGDETLDSIRLERDVPIQGTIQDNLGMPVANAEINASGHKTTTDSDGRFTLHGFEPNPHFQFQMDKKGYVFVNRGVNVRKDGIYWSDVYDDAATEHGPTKQLEIILRPQAWIEGKAIDANTGEPVKLDRVVLCFVERKANGEVVISGCSTSGFVQPEPGIFRMAYSTPDEYHLTFSAAGYNDAEAFTPKVTELRQIDGIEVKMVKKGENVKPTMAKQSISGTITRNGKPVPIGWVSLWRLRRDIDLVNAYILRGRTVVGDPVINASALIRDGKYVLDVPYQNDAWFVVIEEPGQSITQIGPLEVGLNQNKQLDIACTAGGSISGQVKNVPPAWEGCLWVVAFTKTAIRREVRVGNDGAFCIDQLPPGEYGLKVGHDSFKDCEVPRAKDFKDIPKEAWDTMSDPWKRAMVVKVESDHKIGGIELELPKE